MKIAVSGSTGLIGAAVSHHLSANNDVVTIGRRSDSDIYIDFTQPETIRATDFRSIDAIVHCAGVNNGDFRKDRGQAYSKGTEGMCAFMDKLKSSSVAKLVYFSTAQVYGSLNRRITEAAPVNPVSDYAIAHFASEQIARRAADDDLKILVLRPNATFGIPYAPDDFSGWWLVPYSFPLSATRDKKIILLSAGTQRRNFVSADDLARKVATFLYSSDFDSYSMVNPIGPNSSTIYEFAKLVADTYLEETGSECVIERPEPDPIQENEPSSYESDYQFSEARDHVTDYVRSMIRLLESKKELGIN